MQTDPAKNIPEVIEQLEGIIQWCKARQSALGYFPVLYQAVTRAVLQGIENGRFADGERMAKLDVIFANRYLQAWHQHQAGESPTHAWAVAFRAGERRKLTVLHHLFLGINAHINLDLGIAAAQTSPGQELPGLETDFREINQLLFEMVDGVQDKLGELSFLMRWVDRLAGRWDERMANQSLQVVRKNAWRVACRCAEAGETSWERVIQEEDLRTADIGVLISGPGIYGRLLIWLLQWAEKNIPPREIISLLQESTEQSMRSLGFGGER
jgi:hypothetical protein